MAKINIIALFIFLASCGQQQPEQAPTPDSETDQVAIDSVVAVEAMPGVQTSSFREVGETGIVMFPLSTSKPERSGGSFSLYKGSPAGTYWNVVFFNSHTGESRLVSEQKMLITSITPFNEISGINIPDSAGRFIFYSVKTSDVNKDNKLDDKDPESLFASALDGTGFRQLSPPGFHVRQWGVIWSAKKVLMVVTKDTNKDGEFSDGDDEWVYQIDPAKDKEPVEAFSPALKNKIKALLDRDWKKKDN